MLSGAEPPPRPPVATTMSSVTWGAAKKDALPAWSAVTVQVPAAMKVTVLPDTVQIDVVALPKVTVNPELAVALSMEVPPPNVSLDGVAVKDVMVCVVVGTEIRMLSTPNIAPIGALSAAGPWLAVVL